MTWAHQSERGDPLKVLERRQEPPPARTCAGCAHAKTIETPFVGDTITRCLKGKPYGKKCNRYEVADE